MPSKNAQGTNRIRLRILICSVPSFFGRGFPCASDPLPHLCGITLLASQSEMTLTHSSTQGGRPPCNRTLHPARFRGAIPGAPRVFPYHELLAPKHLCIALASPRVTIRAVGSQSVPKDPIHISAQFVPNLMSTFRGTTSSLMDSISWTTIPRRWGSSSSGSSKSNSSCI